MRFLRHLHVRFFFQFLVLFIWMDMWPYHYYIFPFFAIWISICAFTFSVHSSSEFQIQNSIRYVAIHSFYMKIWSVRKSWKCLIIFFLQRNILFVKNWKYTHTLHYMYIVQWMHIAFWFLIKRTWKIEMKESGFF